MDANVITECYADTLLAETVAPPKKGYNHQHACSNVLKTMRTSLINQFALGIIDDDKVVPKEFGEFELVKKHNNSLTLYKHCNRPHYIIKISKAVKDFILNTAQQCGVSLANYNLPSDLENLKKKTKHITSKNDPDLKWLFFELSRMATSDFCKLAQWIEQIKANPYAP
jgi:hypothetical protein